MVNTSPTELVAARSSRARTVRESHMFENELAKYDAPSRNFAESELDGAMVISWCLNRLLRVINVDLQRDGPSMARSTNEDPEHPSCRRTEHVMADLIGKFTPLIENCRSQPHRKLPQI